MNAFGRHLKFCCELIALESTRVDCGSASPGKRKFSHQNSHAQQKHNLEFFRTARSCAKICRNSPARATIEKSKTFRELLRFVKRCWVPAWVPMPGTQQRSWEIRGYAASGADRLAVVPGGCAPCAPLVLLLLRVGLSLLLLLNFGQRGDCTPVHPAQMPSRA